MILTMLDIKRIRELRYGDGLSCREVAEVVGCSESTVNSHAPGQPGKVPNDRLRAAFDRSGITAAEVARRMGWTHTSTWKRANGMKGQTFDVGDSARVKRTLGIMSDISGRGIRSTRTMIDAETAGMMAEVLGLASWEVMPDDELVAA